MPLLNNRIGIVVVRITVVLILCFLLDPDLAKAQEQAARQTLPLFQSEEILELVLEADFKTVFDNTDDSTYYPARMTLTDEPGAGRVIEMEVRTRGKTRREEDVCKFPPLRLRFPGEGTENTPFEGQRAIKLVTHCDKSSADEQHAILEYLIYKAYNILTDSSFKVRPAFISYVYPDADTLRRFAFFLEREKHLAERLGAAEIEDEKIHPNRTNPYQTCLVDLFQYMIGNTDYSIFELHNMILLSDSLRLDPPFPVPYDFDWSGLIDANYAVPHPLIGTEEVTDRVYRGFKKDMKIIFRTIGYFNSKKPEIYQLIESNIWLRENVKKEAIRYLDTFFYIINNERMVQSEFYDRARVVHD